MQKLLHLNNLSRESAGYAPNKYSLRNGTTTRNKIGRFSTLYHNAPTPVPIPPPLSLHSAIREALAF